MDGRGTVTSCGGDRGVGADVALGVVDAVVHSARARYRRRRLPREEEPSDGFDDDALSEEYRLSSSLAAREETRDDLKRGAAAFINDVIPLLLSVRVRKV